MGRRIMRRTEKRTVVTKEGHASLTGNALSFRDTDYYRLIVSSLTLFPLSFTFLRNELIPSPLPILCLLNRRFLAQVYCRAKEVILMRRQQVSGERKEEEGGGGKVGTGNPTSRL